MTRFTLLASVATLAAMPAFAQSNDDAGSSNMSDGQMTQDDGTQGAQNDGQMSEQGQMAGDSGQGGDAEMANDGGSASDMASDSGSEMASDESYQSGKVGARELENMIRTSQIEGGQVYAVDRDDWSAEDWSNTEVVDERGDNWESIGNITDVVLSPDGQQIGLIVSHGGFLDIGDDTVLLNMEEVRRLAPEDGSSANYSYVTRMTEEEIENMPEVEENWW